MRRGVAAVRGTKATAVVMPSLTIPMGGARLRFPAIADGTILNGVRYFLWKMRSISIAMDCMAGAAEIIRIIRSATRNSARGD